MASYVAVPAAEMEQFLQGLRFERTVQREEVVYVRRSQRNQNVQIKVYTSISIRGMGSVRAAGKDAIRICVIWEDGRRSFGIGKFQPVMRVHSIKSVLDRTFERIQAAVKRAKEWMDQEAARNATSFGPPLPPPPKDPIQERLEEKAAFAEYERLQEQAAYEAEMERDYAMEVEAERMRNMAEGKCPDGCCG